jgi:hypothetical protein
MEHKVLQDFVKSIMFTIYKNNKTIDADVFTAYAICNAFDTASFQFREAFMETERALNEEG